MVAGLSIEGFRVEPVKEDVRHLVTGDFKIVGPANGNTPLLKDAYGKTEPVNLAFEENGERLAFPAYVTFFDESHGVITAVIKPAGPATPA